LGALGCGREQLEKRLVEEETAKRVDAAVAARVEEELKSERVQKLIQDKVDAARKQMESDMMEELEREKRRMIDDMRTKELAAKEEKDRLEKQLEENKVRAELEQQRVAAELERQQAERLAELQQQQRQKQEEANKRQQEQKTTMGAQEIILNKSKNARPKLSFSMGKAR